MIIEKITEVSLTKDSYTTILNKTSLRGTFFCFSISVNNTVSYKVKVSVDGELFYEFDVEHLFDKHLIEHAVDFFPISFDRKRGVCVLKFKPPEFIEFTSSFKIEVFTNRNNTVLDSLLLMYKEGY